MNQTTLLLRQAHPNFVVDGQPSSQAFMPFPKDEGNLSVYDGDQVSAAEAFEHYTKTLILQSHSVWAVSKEEADGEGVPASPDPLENFPAHAKLEFTKVSEKTWRKVAKQLKILAAKRGCQHP
jgi:hypothetical protein